MLHFIFVHILTEQDASTRKKQTMQTNCLHAIERAMAKCDCQLTNKDCPSNSVAVTPMLQLSLASTPQPFLLNSLLFHIGAFCTTHFDHAKWAA